LFWSGIFVIKINTNFKLKNPVESEQNIIVFFEERMQRMKKKENTQTEKNRFQRKETMKEKKKGTKNFKMKNSKRKTIFKDLFSLKTLKN
jgi:hypothetical protein